MAAVSLRGVVKRYDDRATVIHGIDLDIRDGEFVVFVGPSGCGKSTLLRMIAGLEDISAGDLLLDGRVANAIPPAQRELAMVFQSYALYPHMTVYENMAFALKLGGHKAADIRTAVERAADVLQIRPLLERRPKELSGGQRQRLAIGRAIVRKPKLFLFDEPLSNLDASLRVQMRVEIGRLHQELKTTMIYVTHDQVEAMTLGERIVVFNGGRIEQVGTPHELYNSPANLFVAGFLGSPKMNFLPAGVAQGVFRLPEGAVTLGIRPEHLHVAGAGEAGVEATVTHVEYLGDQTIVYAAVAGETVAAKQSAQTALLAAGQTVRLHLPPERCLVFGADGARL